MTDAEYLAAQKYYKKDQTFKDLMELIKKKKNGDKTAMDLWHDKVAKLPSKERLAMFAYVYEWFRRQKFLEENKDNTTLVTWYTTVLVKSLVHK